MNSDQPVAYEIKNQVAYVYLNRAPVNAIDHAMPDALHAALG